MHYQLGDRVAAYDAFQRSEAVEYNLKSAAYLPRYALSAFAYYKRTEDHSVLESAKDLVTQSLALEDLHGSFLFALRSTQTAIAAELQKHSE